jgi:hypothetical protein
MNKFAPLSLFYILCFCFIASSCHKEKADLNGQIIIGLTNLKNGLKSASSDTISTPVSIVVTIENASGKVVKNAEKVDLYNMNGDYISKPMSLVKGSYKLTSFLVLDVNNHVIYAAPLQGSPKAYLVQTPLPILFTVQYNVVTKLVPAVISTVGSSAEDFGYVSFSFDVAKTFDFLIGTFVYNDIAKNFELTSASISISGDNTSIYTGQLNSVQSASSVVSIYDSIGVTNKITLPERYNNFTLVISKDGYQTFSQTFTKAELKLHLRSVDKGPLIVILSKSNLNAGLVAYYKFNGDVLDYSGSNNNGTYHGRGAYTTGRLNNATTSIDLNGSTDYVTANNSSSLNPDQITICAWYYAIPFYGNGANSLVTKRSNTGSSVEYQYHLNVLSNLYGGDTTNVHMRQFGFNLTTDQGAYPVTTTGTGDFSYKYYQYQLYEWNFIVGTFDGTSVKLYVNGDLKAWRSAAGKLVKTANDVYIGNLQGLARPNNDFTAGKIDEIRIYDHALTQAEIVTLYQQ